MKTTQTKLKVQQLSRIYRVSERTIRTWKRKRLSLHRPRVLLSELDLQRHRPKALEFVGAAEVEAAYQREADPAAEGAAVRAELAERIVEAEEALCQVRNFARQHEVANGPEIVRQAAAARVALLACYALAGVGEDFDWPEERREDLAAPVSWSWGEVDFTRLK